MQRMMIAAVLAATTATFAGTLCPPQQTAKLTADDGSGGYFGEGVAIDAGVAVIGARFGENDNFVGTGNVHVFEQQADGTWQQTAKLTADDGESGDQFGWSVALDAGVAVIGAYEDDDDNGYGVGSAYIFEQQGNGTWQQTAKLTADDGAWGAWFGNSVAISDGFTVIGAPDDDDDGDGKASGSVYVFEQQGDGTWQQIAKLTADDGDWGDRFGCSVALDAGVAVIGAYGDNEDKPYDSNSGSAYVFDQQGNGTWQQVAKLTADDASMGDNFGISVALDAGVAVIGAAGDGVDGWANGGSAYVFQQQGNGTWQQTTKLTADDGAGADEFGYSVATSGGVTVIGAAYDDDAGSNSGSAYVYEQQENGTWQQVAKLTADDMAYADYFGKGVALDAGVAVVGAIFDDDNGYNSGSAYVFELTGADCNNNGICDTDDLLDGTAADCNENGIPDECDVSDGTSYDCDEDGVLDSCGIADGSVEDCNQNGTPDSCDLAVDPDLDCNENGVLDSCEMEPVLSETAKLTADDGESGDQFGWSVALDAGVAVIGAYEDDDDNGYGVGSAYIFEQQGNGTWQQTAKLTADDDESGDQFGWSVALDAGVAVIGAYEDDDDNGYGVGSAYIFEQQGNGTWQQTAKLTADDGESGDKFGWSVALDAGVAVIGAWCDDDNGTSSGSAYVYEQQADGMWQQIAKLTPDDGASNEFFGVSVALDAGVAVIGAWGDDDNGTLSGSAYVYEQQADGMWQQIAKLTPDDGASADWFGYSVATSGGVAVIGAWGDDDNGSGAGNAYVYEQQADGTWQQTAKLTADDGASGDCFGNSVALDAGVAVIGAYGTDVNGSQSGSAYVFEQQGDGTWQQIAKLTADDGAADDYFGNSVAISGGVVVIGANRDDDNGSDSGSAYVFETFSQGDCDLDGILDICAVADGTVEDCNENGIPDSCDIANGGDADGDGYLDECECAADIAGPGGQGSPDGIVGVNDLLAVIGYWGSSSPGGDVDGDGFVGVHDLLLVISAWGPCP